METIDNKPEFRKNTTAHLVLGVVLVLFGMAFIAGILGDFNWNFRYIVFSWPMLLVVLGIIFIAGRDSKATGVILLAIGAFFLMPRIMPDMLPHYWRSLFWPSLLILFGILIIFSRGRRHYIPGKSTSSEDYLDDVAIFGGGDKQVLSQNFRGGKITNIFGGSKYDFTKSNLADGKSYLEVTMIFGGSKFIVPDDWDIKVEVTSIFGGFSDKRTRNIVVSEPGKTLVFRGITLFGGGEIVNY